MVVPMLPISSSLALMTLQLLPLSDPRIRTLAAGSVQCGRAAAFRSRTGRARQLPAHAAPPEPFEHCADRQMGVLQITVGIEQDVIEPKSNVGHHVEELSGSERFWGSATPSTPLHCRDWGWSEDRKAFVVAFFPSAVVGFVQEPPDRVAIPGMFEQKGIQKCSAPAAPRTAATPRAAAAAPPHHKAAHPHTPAPEIRPALAQTLAS